MVDYIFIDSTEHDKYKNGTLDYIIDTIEYDGQKVLYHSNTNVALNYKRPSKEIIFNCSYEHLQNGYIKDTFNYTNELIGGNNLLRDISIKMYGRERNDKQDFMFYDTLMPYLYHSNIPSKGIGVFTFSTDPESFKLMGHSNFGNMENIEINAVTDRNVSHKHPINFRVYSRALGLLRINNGVCTLL